jgi:hypothetical protein
MHQAMETSPRDGPFLRSADALSSKSYLSNLLCRSFEWLYGQASQNEGHHQEGAGAQAMESLSTEAQEIPA